jgi:hypothetical protein
MEKNADGKLAITRVELRPKITWSGNRRPSVEELDKMHHAAHEGQNERDGGRTVVTVPSSAGMSAASKAHPPASSHSFERHGSMNFLQFARGTFAPIRGNDLGFRWAARVRTKC